MDCVYYVVGAGFDVKHFIHLNQSFFVRTDRERAPPNLLLHNSSEIGHFLKRNTFSQL